MITGTLDKLTATSIIKAKLAIIIPAIFVGTIGGIYFATREITLSQTLMYEIVAPITIIISFAAAILGAKLRTNKMIGSAFQLTNEELVLSKDKKTTIIKIQEIESTKENMYGLTISSKSSSIWIPKQLDNYAEFSSKLKKVKLITNAKNP